MTSLVHHTVHKVRPAPADPTAVSYVLLFAYTDDGGVLVIKKNHPPFMDGKLNGLGGQLEEGESFLQAAVRSFREESGLETYPEEWIDFCSFYSLRQSWSVRCYACLLPYDRAVMAQTMTDEEVSWLKVHAVGNPDFHQPDEYMDNLPWLVWMGWDRVMNQDKFHGAVIYAN